MLVRIAAATLGSLLLSTSVASANEGMWTFDNFPSAKVKADYGFLPTKSFLDHVQHASLRIAGGCSASFISPSGLVMTNHHCVVECVNNLSTPQHDFVQTGYVAKRPEDEHACPNFELDQLQTIEDVTATIQGAVAGKTGEAAVKALNAAEATAQATCGKDPTVRCDVVSLYHGGIYDLYHYRRYTDVRLVFAPEYAVAQFGGDPDNFNFPRYDYDLGMLRAYARGKPAVTPDYLKWSPDGAKAAQLVFVAGNPGGTSRELTDAQLAYERQDVYPNLMPQLGELRGELEQFDTESPERGREAHEDTFFVQNSYKAILGRQAALEDPQFFALKVSAENALRAKVAANPALEASTGSAWDDIAGVQAVRSELRDRVNAANSLEGGVVGDAFTLVEAAAERQKPSVERLPEYTDSNLVAVRQQLGADVPFYPDLAKLELGLRLTHVRENLGTDDPLAHAVLGAEAPDALAARLVDGTKLGDAKARLALYDGGAAAIAASTDPAIAFARALDPQVRAIQKDYQARVDAPTRAAAQRIAKARFAIYGTTVDPDATFTLRLSYGAVMGFPSQGRLVPPFTTIAGLFGRATGAVPYALPPTWLAAKPKLDLATPMNLATTNDIIGGNSGSPLIDQNARVVGLIFDGNIYSLGGEYGYDGARNRAVSVDSRALLAGLRTVYHFDRIVTEIQSAAK